LGFKTLQILENQHIFSLIILIVDGGLKKKSCHTIFEVLVQGCDLFKYISFKLTSNSQAEGEKYNFGVSHRPALGEGDPANDNSSASCKM
jgi:hypothetical protein